MSETGSGYTPEQYESPLIERKMYTERPPGWSVVDTIIKSQLTEPNPVTRETKYQRYDQEYGVTGWGLMKHEAEGVPSNGASLDVIAAQPVDGPDIE